MLEKLLQAAVITLSLSLIAGVRPPKVSEVPNPSVLQALSLSELGSQLQSPQWHNPLVESGTSY